MNGTQVFLLFCAIVTISIPYIFGYLDNENYGKVPAVVIAMLLVILSLLY